MRRCPAHVLVAIVMGAAGGLVAGCGDRGPKPGEEGWLDRPDAGAGADAGSERPAQQRTYLAVVRPDKVDEFRQDVAAIPDEIRTLLQEHNIRDYGIFLWQSKDEVLAVRRFRYTGSDLQIDLVQLNATPAFRQWKSRYEECLVSLPENPAVSSESWAPMEELFHNP